MNRRKGLGWFYRQHECCVEVPKASPREVADNGQIQINNTKIPHAGIPIPPMPLSV